MTSMAECPYCKEKKGANDFRPSEEEACSVCGNRPESSPPADAWWLSAPPLEPLPTAAGHEQLRPNVTPLAPTEAIVGPESKKPETVPTVASPPPPRMLEPSRPTHLPRFQADDDEEPLSL